MKFNEVAMMVTDFLSENDLTPKDIKADIWGEPVLKDGCRMSMIRVEWNKKTQGMPFNSRILYVPEKMASGALGVLMGAGSAEPIFKIGEAPRTASKKDNPQDFVCSL